MIKINKPNQPKNPKIYQSGERKDKTYHEVATEQIKKDFEEGKEIEFRESVYQDFKKELWLTIQHGKCCYCESKLYEKAEHQKAGDVEHFRPKNGYKQDINSETILKPSYYWLAYEWDNLLFACEVCNNKPYKENKFPLIDDTKRAKSHLDSIGQEEPYLLNPAKENPEEHIAFRQEFIIPKSVRGGVSIKILGLDRKGLNEARREYLERAKNILDLYLYLDHLPENLRKQVENNIREYKQSNQPFSAMIRANFPEV